MPDKPPKFNGIDFSVSEVQALRPDHFENCGRGFRCKRGEFGQYWRDRIPREIGSQVGKCWVIVEKGSLAGYITLLADKLSTESENVKLLHSEGVKYQSYPAVKIGLLAADERARGAGGRLMDWALDYIATELVPRLGVRFVTVDALFDPDKDYDASTFYRDKYGFIYANPDAESPKTKPYKTMYLDIRPMVDALNV